MYKSVRDSSVAGVLPLPQLERTGASYVARQKLAAVLQARQEIIASTPSLLIIRVLRGSDQTNSVTK